MRPQRPQNGAGATPAESVGTSLGALLAGQRASVVVERGTEALGRFGLRLLRSNEEEEVTIEVADWMRELGEARGISPELLGATGQLPVSSRVTRHTLARAVRAPRLAAGEPGYTGAPHVDAPFGTLEEWGGLDEHVIGEAWDLYAALVAERDPLARPLTPDEITEIGEAIKKKATTLLYSFGARKLVAYVTTSADPLSS